MIWLRRIFLFILVNVAITATVSLLASLLGLNPNLRFAHSGNLNNVLMACFLWGMTSAIISLLISKWMAKWMMGLKVIEQSSASYQELELFEMVQRIAQKAGLKKTPEVAIYDSMELNAFATGPSRNTSLVAVSTGLMRHLSKPELEGVLGHEISHITNGDMVTMTLLQGVVNSFSLFLSNVIAYAVRTALTNNKDRESSQNSGEWIGIITRWICDIIFTLIGSIIVAWFSRKREFRADSGSALLVGKEKMIAALQALKQNLKYPHEEPQATGAIQSLQIFGKTRSFWSLFATHPDLDDRIEALRILKK